MNREFGGLKFIDPELLIERGVQLGDGNREGGITSDVYLAEPQKIALSIFEKMAEDGANTLSKDEISITSLNLTLQSYENSIHQDRQLTPEAAKKLQAHVRNSV